MKQAEKIYMISDAAKQIEVEAHVLRYWEEELRLPVKRNEMGHRYYTQEDIRQFCRIRELKEQGLQLKAIRSMLKNGMLKEPMLMFSGNTAVEQEEIETQKPQEEEGPSLDLSKRHVVMVKKGELLQGGSFPAIHEETREQKSLRLQQLLRDMIVEAVQNNNREICQEIKESLLKELDYQFRLQEEREDARDEERIRKQEEHYRQIDELIRSYNQKGKGDSGISGERKRFYRLGRKEMSKSSLVQAKDIEAEDGGQELMSNDPTKVQKDKKDISIKEFFFHKKRSEDVSYEENM